MHIPLLRQIRQLHYRGWTLVLPLAMAVFSASTSAQAATPVAQSENYKRIDFLVTNTSCAACIYRLEHKFLDAPAVKKAAIMYVKPFAGAVIFDPSKTNWSKLSANILKGETAQFQIGKERLVRKVPAVLIPEGSKGNKTTASQLPDHGMFNHK